MYLFIYLFRFWSNPVVAVFTGVTSGLCLPNFHLLDWRRLGVQDVRPHRGEETSWVPPKRHLPSKLLTLFNLNNCSRNVRGPTIPIFHKKAKIREKSNMWRPIFVAGLCFLGGLSCPLLPLPVTECGWVLEPACTSLQPGEKLNRWRSANTRCSADV